MFKGTGFCAENNIKSQPSNKVAHTHSHNHQFCVDNLQFSLQNSLVLMLIRIWKLLHGRKEFHAVSLTATGKLVWSQQNFSYGKRTYLCCVTRISWFQLPSYVFIDRMTKCLWILQALDKELVSLG